MSCFRFQRFASFVFPTETEATAFMGDIEACPDFDMATILPEEDFFRLTLYQAA